MAASGLGLPGRPARAATGADLKFVFVVANGGWDPTCAFAPEFGNSNVDMEGQAGRGSTTDARHATKRLDEAFNRLWI